MALHGYQLNGVQEVFARQTCWIWINTPVAKYYSAAVSRTSLKIDPIWLRFIEAAS
jgi:hypothetical protein